MKPTCPDCGSVIADEDLDRASNLAKCTICHSVFSFEAQAQKPVASVATTAEMRFERPSHARSELKRTSNELSIHVPPAGLRTALSWFLLIFSLGWLFMAASSTLDELGIAPAPKLLGELQQERRGTDEPRVQDDRPDFPAV